MSVTRSIEGIKIVVDGSCMNDITFFKTFPDGNILQVYPQYSYSCNPDERTYPRIAIGVSPKGKTCWVSVHELLMKAFFPHCTALWTNIDHIDRNRHNFCFTNLRWCSPIFNSQNRAPPKPNIYKETRFKGVIQMEGLTKTKVFDCHQDCQDWLTSRRKINLQHLIMNGHVWNCVETNSDWPYRRFK